jgi:hypothetical protein
MYADPACIDVPAPPAVLQAYADLVDAFLPAAAEGEGASTPAHLPPSASTVHAGRARADGDGPSGPPARAQHRRAASSPSPPRRPPHLALARLGASSLKLGRLAGAAAEARSDWRCDLVAGGGGAALCSHHARPGAARPLSYTRTCRTHP